MTTLPSTGEEEDEALLLLVEEFDSFFSLWGSSIICDGEEGGRPAITRTRVPSYLTESITIEGHGLPSPLTTLQHGIRRGDWSRSLYFSFLRQTSACLTAFNPLTCVFL